MSEYVYGYGQPGGMFVLVDGPTEFEMGPENPGENALSPDADRLLRTLISQLGWKAPVYISPAWQQPVISKKLDAVSIQHQREDTLEEIQSMSPQVIAVCGQQAADIMFPGEGNIQKTRGLFRWVKILGVDYLTMVTIDPRQVIAQNDLFRDMLFDFQNICNYANRRAMPRRPELYIVESLADIQDMAANIRGCKGIAAADIETATLEPVCPPLVTGIMTDPKYCWIIPHTAMASSTEKVHLVRNVLCDPRVKYVMHNGYQFDIKFLRKFYNADMQLYADTMLLSYCVDERQGYHGLKTQARLRLQFEDYDSHIDKEHMAAVPVKELYQYLGQDCQATYLLHPILHDLALEDDTLCVHNNILLPAARVLGRMEARGVPVDIPYLNQKAVELSETMDGIRHKLSEMLGEDFNPRSTKQVARILYDIAGESEQTGRDVKPRSTNKKVLDNMDTPAAGMIKEYRQWGTVRSTHVVSLAEEAVDSMLYPDFLLFGTQTGRLSCRNPNVQNVPACAGPIVRDAFVAPPGWTLIEADYKQLELRVATYYSKDPYLTQIFKDNRDPITEMSIDMHGKPADQIVHHERIATKTIVYGVLYGRSAASIAKDSLHCPVAQAQRFVNKFFGKARGLKIWIGRQQEQAIRDHESVTLTGRKRRYPLITKDNAHEVKRRAVNSPIQGFSSDIGLLRGLIPLDRKYDPSEAQLWFSVHDSVLSCVRDDVVDKYIKIIRETMEEPMFSDQEFLFKVDIKVGKRWGSLEKLK